MFKKLFKKNRKVENEMNKPFATIKYRDNRTGEIHEVDDTYENFCMLVNNNNVTFM